MESFSLRSLKNVFTFLLRMLDFSNQSFYSIGNLQMTLFKKIFIQLLIAAMALTGFSALVAEETSETPSEQTESSKETKSEKKEKNLRNPKSQKNLRSRKNPKKKKQKVKKKKLLPLPNLLLLQVKNNNIFLSVYLLKDRRTFPFIFLQRTLKTSS